MYLSAEVRTWGLVKIRGRYVFWWKKCVGGRVSKWVDTGGANYGVNVSGIGVVKIEYSCTKNKETEECKTIIRDM